MEQNINKTKTEVNDKITTPYLSVARLDRVIDLASNRNFSTISYSLFEQYGFSRSDAILAFNLFRFLGLVDKNGKATDLMSKLHLHGDVKKQEFEKIVRAAYKKLFDATNGKPHTLNKEELSNEFAIHYNLTPRIVRSAIPVFLKLCEYAGLREETQAREVGSKVKKEKRLPQSTKETPGNADFFPIPIAEGKMVLNIPNELHTKILEGENEEFNKAWRELISKLKEFAKDHLQDNIPEKESPEENSEES